VLLWRAPCRRDKVNFSSSTVVNTPRFLVLLPCVAHSSSGLGHLPLKEEITGSNPVCATKFIVCRASLKEVLSLFGVLARRGAELIRSDIGLFMV
jgi:hypothetical protein